MPSDTGGYVLLKTALRRAVDDMRGRTHTFAIEDAPPTFETLLEMRGSTAKVAELAGFGKPRQHKKGTDAYRQRETFMRQLRFYRSGTRSIPPEREKLFAGLVSREQRRRASPTTHEGVVELIKKWGLTVVHCDFLGWYSSDNIERSVRSPGYWISPGTIEFYRVAEYFLGRHWQDAAPAFTSAFSEAWIGEDVIDIEKVRDLKINIGRYTANGKTALAMKTRPMTGER